ncbi:hypothetical protein GWK47_020760 [Chionoecetes opilio]|uniref:Uncharacterized protein n=1 Tax=Chionoecetes opilio TaxID=41210 RepID=A0A8J4XQR5_CHIOP|nr:hypothetical protein GWK47_020760 [Chionoecetes opilio]
MTQHHSFIARPKERRTGDTSLSSAPWAKPQEILLRIVTPWLIPILNFIDNIAATQTSLNNLSVTSTSCSARGHCIDKDWSQHIASHSESRGWWTSGKPCKLQRSSTSTVTTGTQIDSPNLIPPSRSAPAITEVSPPQPPKTQHTPPSTTATPPNVTLTDNQTSQTPTPSATHQPKDAVAITTTSDDRQSYPPRTSQPTTRPPAHAAEGTKSSQGNNPIHFLHTNIDTLLLQHSCNHLIVVGDMNQHLVARQFEDLLTEYGLSSHVNFPTHTSGSSLDPVITDLSDEVITCLPLGMVGSLDNSGVLTTISTTVCRRAADKKSRAWLRYKSHPSQLNKHRHKESCKTMCQVQKQVIQRWREDIKAKYSGHHQAPQGPASPSLHPCRPHTDRSKSKTVPFSRTEHHLRSFLPRYGRLWNQLVHQTDLHHHASLQDFKRGVNSWVMD